MADEVQNEQETPKSGGKKSIIVVAALLLFEAAAIIGVMKLAGGTPEVAEAAPELSPEMLMQEKIVEVLVLDGKLPNSKSGCRTSIAPRSTCR